jgi:hypothetical protein
LTPAESEQSTGGPAKGAPPAPTANYVFKIVKADPKNTTNFEDVADK